MTAAIQKTIGSTITITGVQKSRKLSSVAVVINDTGLYSVIISYQETSADGNGVQVGATVFAAKVIDDSQLPAAAKTEIDSIYVRALAAL